jgi:hypothetical protein
VRKRSHFTKCSQFDQSLTREGQAKILKFGSAKALEGVLEDSANDGSFFDEGHDLHWALAAGKSQRVDLTDLLQQSRSIAPALACRTLVGESLLWGAVDSARNRHRVQGKYHYQSEPSLNRMT